MKKAISTIAAIAAASTMAVSVSAADWSQCSYADNDPTTLKLLEQNSDGVTFTNSDTSPDICKARITIDKILKNTADCSKVAKMEWTVTYTGVTPELVAEAGLAGGTYAIDRNSTGYQIEPDSSDDDDNYIWDKDTYSTVDSVEFEDGISDTEGEIVFMDWSYASIGEQGVKVSITDLKIYDKDGNELEQLGYGEWLDPATAEATEDTAEEAPAETEAPVEEDTHTPGDDDMTKEDNAETGNLDWVVASVAVGAAAVVAGVKGKKIFTK